MLEAWEQDMIMKNTLSAGVFATFLTFIYYVPLETAGLDNGVGRLPCELPPEISPH